MTSPLVSPDELGIYLSDPAIDLARAMLMIDLATSTCSSIIDPLPDAAKVVVMRVAARGYVSTLSTRQQEYEEAGSPFGGGAYGGIYLTGTDVIDLRRLSGGGGAFSINLLPADYALPDQALGWQTP